MKRTFSIAGVTLLMAVSLYAIPPGTNDEISARLKPFGEICRQGDECGTAMAVVATGPLSGEEVYNQFCFACHATGVGQAPRLGVAEEWGARADKSMDELMISTLNGLNTMPPKGTCMNCSDEELADAVTYMLDAL